MPGAPAGGRTPCGPAPAAGAHTLLKGCVERITFHAPDQNGFCVLQVAVPGMRELAKVIGNAIAVQAGEVIEAEGVWENHRQHGLQFQAKKLVTMRPSSVEAMEKYLASGLVKGIGKVYAKRLVEAFGEQVFDVIEREPERLRGLHGIGERRVERLVKGWQDHRVIRRIMTFLADHEISPTRAVRVFKTYGAEAIEIITANPYRLARDIRGIGFVTADRVALRLGIGKDSEERARAGIQHTLAEMIDEQCHCAFPGREFLDRVTALLETSEAVIRAALAREKAEGTVVIETVDGEPCVAPAHLWRDENDVAARLRALCAGAPPWAAIDADKALEWAGRVLGFDLSPGQASAVRTALAAKAMVITGGPGTGKTSLLRAILYVLSAKGVRVALAAPTGRAAQRMMESIRGPAGAPLPGPLATALGALEAKTIHRLLEIDPNSGGFLRTAANPLDCDLLVLDESSMVDVRLMAAILRALPDRTALLIVGDSDQLPSVGPGQVLADVIDSGLLPVARLDRVFRQAEKSHIIRAAHAIRTGTVPTSAPGRAPDRDFHILSVPTPGYDLPDDVRRAEMDRLNALAAERIVALVRFELPYWLGRDPVRDIQVLAPASTTDVGVDALNKRLQDALNPRLPGMPVVERFGTQFRPGDKLIHTVNDYDKEVWNGDIGLLVGVDMEAEEVTVAYGAGGAAREVVYGFGELDQLSLAYAITIHKAQGSEFPIVVMPVMGSHWVMLQRNLLYTGVTRGREMVLLVGQERAICHAVRVPTPPRRSRLKALLAAGMAGGTAHRPGTQAAHPKGDAPDSSAVANDGEGGARYLAVETGEPAAEARSGVACDDTPPDTAVIPALAHAARAPSAPNPPPASAFAAHPDTPEDDPDAFAQRPDAPP